MTLKDYNGLKRFALSLCHNRGAAEDLVQDAWIAAATANKLSDNGFIVGCIRNVFRNTMRSRDIAKRYAVGFKHINNDMYTCQPQIRIDTYKCMNALKPKQYMIVKLLALNPDATQRELATMAGLGKFTVTHHLNVAREVFKDAV